MKNQDNSKRTISKYVKLPKDLERAEIDAPKHIKEFDYDRALQEDFETHREQYREVELYGVMVKVKVKPKDEL